MKQYIQWLFVFILALLISGCGQAEDHSNHQVGEDGELKEPKVEIKVTEKANKGETVPISATVYYGDELVDDAKVTFEIKRGEASEEIEAELGKKGTYEIKYQFVEDGTYTIIAHTDVRKIHTMPQTTIQIGDGDDTSTQEESDEHEAHSH